MEITKKDITRHYFSSLGVYGVTLLLLIACPVFHQTIKHPYLNYIVVLSGYYLLYAIFAYPILLRLKPESILQSRNTAIIEYFKRLFRKDITLEKKLSNITPVESEKQAFIILFIKAFFGTYCINMLCNEFLPSFSYYMNFLTKMYSVAAPYFSSGAILSGFIQYIDDTADMWLKLIFTVTTLVYALSYLTETSFLGNKIKYADTTPLGILSCLACFYPFMALTVQIIPTSHDKLVSVDNMTFRILLYIILIIANFISMIAVLRLGSKAGNLTNRGIVTGFPYNIVRHPDYAMQMVYIIITVLPICIYTPYILGKILFGLGGIFWLILYNIRAVTEERNLIKDKSYIEYSKKVKYRYIPWVI